jgi:hypothetical protein
LMETLARLIDARVLEYVTQSDFESLYKLIRHAEQTLNGFMTYVRRQRTGSQEYGDKTVSEEQGNYDPFPSDNESMETDNNQIE